MNTLKIPISVVSLQDLNSLKKGQLITFTCKKCRKKITRCFARSRINLISRFLCKKCNYEESCLEKYGCVNAAQAPEIKAKFQETNLKKYGNVCSLNGREQIEKKKETWKKHFGKTNPYQKDSVKDHRKTKCLEKYGVEYPIVLFHDKALSTRLEKYGTLRPQNFKYQYDNIKFDSWWEVCFYLYQRDLGNKVLREPQFIEYEFENKKHKFYVDFSVNGKLYEIKSTYLLKLMPKEKLDCIVNNDVVIISDNEIKKYLSYVSENYPELKSKIDKKSVQIV